MKTLLITGKNGYVANHLAQDLGGKYRILRTDVKTKAWEQEDWSQVDVVIHAAALVHNNQPDATMEDYMKVNYALTKNIAQKAKASGVKQFIFMSTANVYGLTGQVGKPVKITAETPIQPHTAYGISKWYAEGALNELASAEFKVAYLRPPMIYGPGAPGNFSRLEKVAKRLPIIPDIQNQRSAIFIEHFTQFVEALIQSENGGVYHPQDGFDLNTTRVIQTIRKIQGQKTLTIPLPNRLIKSLNHVGIARKLYGNLKYDMHIDEVSLDYPQKDFYTVMALTLNHQ